ncbi:hypothetical protein [Brachybacterium sp.]|uniref:hypothetical protein n=1 Tax=Brachybacterium sp. TaxID=1891286 RepID=UPI002ED56C04
MPTPHSPDNSPDAVERPFGAHLSMRWWAPVLLTVIVVVATYGLQALFLGAAAPVEVGFWGKGPQDATLTPLTYLANNLSIMLLVPVTLLALRALTGTPWRSVLALNRAFSWRRLGGYTALFIGLMVVLNIWSTSSSPVRALPSPSPGPRSPSW